MAALDRPRSARNRARTPGRFRGWLPLVLLPIAAIFLTPATWPRWALMWTLAFAIYCGCKWLTWRRCHVRSPIAKQLAYLLAWPGMDAAAFLGADSKIDPPTAREWLFAGVKVAIGALLFFGVARSILPEHEYWAGWVGMAGLVLMLHFGLFHVLSCFWRSASIDARPLMNWPLCSRSLSEFWGRRWNTAFRDLTHRYLFRPLSARLGVGGAVMVGFMFSGVVHEIVISYPAGGGYGGPTLFFVIQGIALLVERRLSRTCGGTKREWIIRLYAIAVLLVPAGLLFHTHFVSEIILPFMKAVRSL